VGWVGGRSVWWCGLKRIKSLSSVVVAQESGTGIIQWASQAIRIWKCAVVAQRGAARSLEVERRRDSLCRV